MLRTRSVIILLIIAILLSVSITYFVIESASMPNLSKSENLVNQATGNSANILKHFDSYANLEGFVLQGKSANSPIGILYTDRSGRYLINGQVFTADGTDLARADFAKYVQPQTATQAFAAAAGTSWIQEGSDQASHKLYIVADPNCLFCNDLYKQIQASVQSGQLAVRWIIVGFLKPNSTGRAYAILAAKNPAKALEINEQGFKSDQEEGGIAPLNNASARVKAQFAKNMAFMRDNSIMSTPTMLYRDQSKLVQLQAGLTANTKINTFINSLSDQWQ